MRRWLREVRTRLFLRRMFRRVGGTDLECVGFREEPWDENDEYEGEQIWIRR